MTDLQVQHEVELYHLNTFHVAARARYFTEITREAQLPALCQWLREHPVPHLLIGQASNILFREDFPGIVIEFKLKGIHLEAETDDYIEVA
ncbi:MAG: hypothetical protein LBE21_05065, partial [Pseudomonadales bacterium]|nr:hypothetical protein [Pseudomonadales bacterium]